MPPLQSHYGWMHQHHEMCMCSHARVSARVCQW